MVRITNLFFSAFFAVSFCSICIRLDLGEGMPILALVSSFFISYFLLRHVRPKGYFDEIIQENEELKAKIQELELQNNNYKIEIMKLENKIEYQKEIVEITKDYQKTAAK
jgi:hypothetical protein